MMRIVIVIVFCGLTYVSSAPEQNISSSRIVGFDDFRGEKCSEERACESGYHCCSDVRYCCPKGMYCINGNMVTTCSYDPKYSSGSKGFLAKSSYIINKWRYFEKRIRCWMNIKADVNC